MWRRGMGAIRRGFRGVSTAVRRHLEDEGDWSFSPEWWEPDSAGLTVFRQLSGHGNGVVSVVAHPSSRPDSDQWPAIERWLQQRYVQIHPESDPCVQLRILGYQWRVLHFNDNTRQSTAKVLTAFRKSDPGSLYLMQQPHCLAVPYLKSLLSVGLATLASVGFDIMGAVSGSKLMRILCIGHGGGSLPLFLASKFQGAIIHIVEIDPVVVSASMQAMGFPACEVKDISGESFILTDSPNQELWQGIQDRLCLYISDAEGFILDNENVYDLVFVDAYDGDDIFPHKLWDPDGPFLKSLGNRVHPDHGTVVVNLHADSDILAAETDHSHFENILPMGKYVSQVCRAYKKHLGLAYKVSVPWLCNISLVACRRGDRRVAPSLDRNSLLNALIANSHLVEFVLGLPFPCVQYIKRGFALID
uniref:Methyltransferase-like protein 13 n=1 Tax=Anthurium amnicola TaxID=1678845 RepID=A0A1D1YW00_9ARAE